jgi:hypothetical protein
VAWSRRSRILLPALTVASLAVSLYLAGPLRSSFLAPEAPPSVLALAVRGFYDIPVILASAAVDLLDEWGTERMWTALLFPLVLLQNLGLWLLVHLALGRHAAR